MWKQASKFQFLSLLIYISLTFFHFIFFTTGKLIPLLLQDPVNSHSKHFLVSLHYLLQCLFPKGLLDFRE